MQRTWFLEERLAIAARGVGAMWRLLDETVAWADRTRAGRQPDLRLPGRQLPARRLGRRRRRRPAARRYQVAALADAGADPKVVHAKASMAKLFVSEAACRCADRACRPSAGVATCARIRRRAAAARAAGRPDLGGHQRDPAADRRPRPRAPRRRADAALGHPRPTLDSGSRHGPDPAARAPLDRGRRRHRPRGRLRRHRPAQPRAQRVRGRRSGASTRNASEVLGRACFPCVAELPEPVDAVVVAIPAPGVPGRRAGSGERGCGGAVVISAGFGEVEQGRRAPGRAARGRAAGRPAALRAERQRDHLGAGRGPDVGRLRSSRSSPARWR